MILSFYTLILAGVLMGAQPPYNNNAAGVKGRLRKQTVVTEAVPALAARCEVSLPRTLVHGRRSRSAASGRCSEAKEEKATSNKVALQATTVAPIAFLARRGCVHQRQFWSLLLSKVTGASLRGLQCILHCYFPHFIVK